MGVLTAVGRALGWGQVAERASGAETLAYMLEASGRGTRASKSLTSSVTQETALRNSVWWAGLNLWADVVSSFPLDVMRPTSDGLMAPAKTTNPMFTAPGGADIDITEFMFSSTFDKCRYGNFIGIITGLNGLGLVSQVEMVPMSAVVAKMKGRTIDYWKIDGKRYERSDIWHEKMHTMAGFALGLSPLAYAANTMNIYQSAQDFAADWFAVGANPRGVLQNNERPHIPTETREDAKQSFRESTAGGDIFVVGKEWDWTPANQDQMSSNFLAQMNASDRDVCRFVGVPASMIDVEISTGNITYANVTQANLQWLITKMGPFARRTERYWSRQTTPQPWDVKMNTSALLRMDDQTRQNLFIAQVNAMIRTPNEVRALDNLPPLTDEQMTEIEVFARLRKPPPVGTPTDPLDPMPEPSAAPVT